MDRESLMNNAIQGSQGTSLVVQWLRFHASNAGGVGLGPGWGTKIPHAVRMHEKNDVSGNRLWFFVCVSQLFCL